MNTIKIAALTRYNKIFGSYYDDFYSFKENLSNLMDDYTKQVFNDENSVLSSWWYLHGDLQSFIGFDQGIILNYNDLPKIINKVEYIGKTLNEVCIEEGIYDVEIIGINKPCIGYFWNDDSRTRGLVCFKSDFDACEDAYKKFIEKPKIL